MTKNEQNNKPVLSFAALYPYEETNIVEATEKEVRGQDFISWGDQNQYPFYLFDLYKNVATLQAIINGCVDYICGDSIKSNVIQLDDDEMNDLIYDIAMSYVIYGGFALNVVRNKLGGVALVKCLDFRNVRSNKDNTVLYYSEDFEKKSYGRGKYIAYPKFDVNDKNPSSIFYFKNNRYQTYPMPVYAGAIKACEIERSVDEYHLNNLNNNFMASVLISLNNGVPTDEVKDEIERNFNEKFTGKDNAGRIVISYGNDKEHSAEIQKIETEDFAERYNTLVQRTSKQIFTAFRATPSLFGIPTENNGFAAEQYKDQYSLFYTTVIMPMQKKIVKSLNNIFSVDQAVMIEPFTVKFESGTVANENISE